MNVDVRSIATWGLVALLASPAARAESKPASPEELALARQLFAEAAALEARSDWVQASVGLKRALAIKETPGLRYHLAHCEEQLGAYVAAALDYQRASELIRRGAQAPDVEPLLAAAERRVDAKVARLELHLPDVTGVSVELDGRALPASALTGPVRVEPGVHHVVARAPGQADFRADVAFTAGERRELLIWFAAADSAAAAAAATPLSADEKPPSARANAERPDQAGGTPLVSARTGVLLAEGAAVLVGTGLGIGYAFARQSASERVRSAQHRLDLEFPNDTHACATGASSPTCGELVRAIDDYSRNGTLEKASFIGAGVGAALFAATWLLWPAKPPKVALELRPQARTLTLLTGGSF